MNTIELTLIDPAPCYRPGETVRGTVNWQLEESPRSIEARLLWYTQGKGTTDMQVVAVEPSPQLLPAGQWRFALKIPPRAVRSYTGQLLSIVWAVEVVAEKKLAFTRQDIVVLPTGAAVVAPADT